MNNRNRVSRIRRRDLPPASLVLVILMVLTGGPANADTLSDGYLVGRAVSHDGGEVAGVSITIVDASTGSRYQAVSSVNGRFRFPVLRPGTYSLVARLTGYADTTLENIVVRVGTGTQVDLVLEVENAPIEVIEVIASAVSRIDLLASEAALTLDETTIDSLPLLRDSSGLAMLVPGAVAGNPAFGNGDRSGFLPAVGGASVAENAYYLNGMNITNFRSGRGGRIVPFEFLDQHQVKYAGISAEFGRATGAVVNSLTKRGGNDFRFGAGIYYEPAGLAATGSDRVSESGVPAYLGSLSKRSLNEAYAYASGPLIEDKLFFYAMVNPRDIDLNLVGSTLTEGRSNDWFWGLKVDYEMNESNLIELTAFSDDQDFTATVFDIDAVDFTKGDERGMFNVKRGGTHGILKYTGWFTESLSLSILAGYSRFDSNQNSAGDASPVIFDNRGATPFVPLGSWTSIEQSDDDDQRDMVRVDLEWLIGNHLLRIGADYEFKTSFSEQRFSGDEFFAYFNAVPGQMLPTGIVPPDVFQVAQRRVFSSGGEFDTVTSSWYVEDSWQIVDSLTVNMGLRNEAFDNRDANGDTFVRISDQWAPRFGVVWSPGGYARQKIYASYGRYYLPVASITNIALGGEVFAREEWFTLNGLNPDDTPMLGTQIGGPLIFADGEIADPGSLADRSIEPMFQDEFALGFETELGKSWVAGMNFVDRILDRVIEDSIIDAPLFRYAQENGFLDFLPGGFDYRVLLNPGYGADLRIDLDGDGSPESIHLTAESIGLPKARRQYRAVNVFAQRPWSDGWFIRADYTWSKSYGNIEGSVRTETREGTAGFTSNFDLPALADGAYGNLPNDRRHALRLYGAWEFSPGWTAGLLTTWHSGGPRNVLGFHPTDARARQLGPVSFYDADARPVPRGTSGTTPSVTRFDVSLSYVRSMRDSASLTFQLDVFNVLNSQAPTAYWEVSELLPGTPDPRFGLPSVLQSPRTVRLSARIDY